MANAFILYREKPWKIKKKILEFICTGSQSVGKTLLHTKNNKIFIFILHLLILVYCMGIVNFIWIMNTYI